MRPPTNKDKDEHSVVLCGNINGHHNKELRKFKWRGGSIFAFFYILTREILIPLELDAPSHKGITFVARIDKYHNSVRYRIFCSVEVHRRRRRSFPIDNRYLLWLLVLNTLNIRDDHYALICDLPTSNKRQRRDEMYTQRLICGALN
jgi:hypothetical protein